VRLLGELTVTVALVIVLFVVYQLYVAGWSAAENQRQVTAELQQEWERAPGALPTTPAHTPTVSIGDPFAVLRIPALGADWRFTVVEGTGQDELARGPGHYVGTDFPGQPGNVGIAGHRVTHATPFDRLDELGSCAAIVVETQDAWFVYRVLPMAEERAAWTEMGDRRQCAGVAPLGGEYADTVGREIVTPDRTDVLAAVPHRPDLDPSSAARLNLLTLTTCHPRFSARKRMVIHAVQVRAYDKHEQASGFRPVELSES
jgi:sortase (surface protein transpeptidase)